MTHFAFALDEQTNDLFLREDGNLAVVTGAEAVGQHGRQRLKSYRGEWFLDVTAGMPWLDQIFGKRYNPALAEAVAKAELLGTDGIVAITSFSVSFLDGPRNLVMKDIQVTTVYDPEEEVSV